MLPFLPIAQVTPQEIVQIQQVRELPGSLDRVLVFNSNSPELIQKAGILLSTFPPNGKKSRVAHLNFPLQGRFDIFAHHVAKPPTANNLRSLYLGIILHNPNNKPLQVNILQAATYLSQPDAPFIELPALSENPLSKIFAGPGDRVTNAILRGQRHSLPPYIVLPPRQSRLLINLPIPVKTLNPPINGRSLLMRLQSPRPIYAASLAMYAPLGANKKEVAPTLTQWQSLLFNGSLVSPRDRAPTPPEQTTNKIIYGRVAGIAQGSQWTAQIVDPQSPYLTIPRSRQAFSYGLSTLPLGKLGTNQVQSAPLLARYPDTAYSAHGNYGIQYNLSLPLHNNTDRPQTVTVSLQTPLKEDKLSKSGLRFLSPPASQVFFRGTVRVAYTSDRGLPQTRYIHLVQKRGEQGAPLVKLTMKPQDTRLVQVNFLYPPDATPPQVLTIATNG
ncbi:MAG: DUF3370 domain-containing protein [Chroococcus sp. CMT-3BRIN-NPC107]|jgi:hypothetical protein|nr:DUF3370 domain-containing protein [Chroococcus sp. CMT-3BRIN-NPC107]